MSLGRSERYAERTCSLCNKKFRDCTTSYCRPCHNAYYAWRQRQKRQGLPTTIAEYRRVMNKPRLPKQSTQERIDTMEAAGLKTCPICLEVHDNPHSAYCPKCKSWYQYWAQQQRELYATSNGATGEARPTVEMFRNLVYDMRRQRT